MAEFLIVASTAAWASASAASIAVAGARAGGLGVVDLTHTAIAASARPGSSADLKTGRQTSALRYCDPNRRAIDSRAWIRICRSRSRSTRAQSSYQPGRKSPVMALGQVVWSKSSRALSRNRTKTLPSSRTSTVMPLADAQPVALAHEQTRGGPGHNPRKSSVARRTAETMTAHPSSLNATPRWRGSQENSPTGAPRTVHLADRTPLPGASSSSCREHGSATSARRSSGVAMRDCANGFDTGADLDPVPDPSHRWSAGALPRRAVIATPFRCRRHEEVTPGSPVPPDGPRGRCDGPESTLTAGACTRERASREVGRR
jgi:hypothetical protein